jgi:putative transcriptional regulator
MPKQKLSCENCGKVVRPERESHRYEEGGLPNVVLQGVEVRRCGACGFEEIAIPHLLKVHRAIASGLVNSPHRLTGAQFRFLRKHLDLSGEQLAGFLHTDKTKISKWEREEDPIGPSTDRLMRLLVAALDPELSAMSAAVARRLPGISDESGTGVELHVDVLALTVAYFGTRAA